MVVFCSVWGIWWWRQTVWNAVTASLRTDVCALPSVDDWLGRFDEYGLRDVWQSYLRRGIPGFVAMDVLVSGRVPSLSTKWLRLRQWNGPVLYGSVCLAGDMLVCSPEFCFLQVCADVRRLVADDLEDKFYLVILVELGCELCGLYSRQNTPRGHKKRRNPLTNTGELLYYLGRIGATYGARRMREALFWIADGLASPMETALYMMLCLPTAVGGCAIPRPIVNWKLLVAPHLRAKTQREHVVPDLCWPEARLVVEYDSDEDHRGQGREDQERRELLQDMGYIVVVFHSDDVMDGKKFDQKAKSITSHLGRRLPEASEGFLSAQLTLRTMLLKHERWI